MFPGPFTGKYWSLSFSYCEQSSQMEMALSCSTHGGPCVVNCAVEEEEAGNPNICRLHSSSGRNSLIIQVYFKQLENNVRWKLGMCKGCLIACLLKRRIIGLSNRSSQPCPVPGIFHHVAFALSSTRTLKHLFCRPRIWERKNPNLNQSITAPGECMLSLGGVGFPARCHCLRHLVVSGRYLHLHPTSCLPNRMIPSEALVPHMACGMQKLDALISAIPRILST